MRDLATDTAVVGSNGRFQASLSEEWAVWGPMGGYLAALALRAAGAAGPLPRPASFACQFLSVAEFDAVDLAVTTLRQSKRTAALRVSMTQRAKPVLEALVWLTAAGMEGLEHDAATLPDVPLPEQLRPLSVLAPNYDEWPAFWRHVEGRPTDWNAHREDEPGPPVFSTWFRLLAGTDVADPFLDAGRALLFLDAATWPAAASAHPWPSSHIAPNLDLSVQFHRLAPEARWLLADGFSPVGADGLIGCTGRLWTPAGRLVASSAAQLVCRPHPFLEQQRARVAEQEAAREPASGPGGADR